MSVKKVLDVILGRDEENIKKEFILLQKIMG